MKVLNCIVYYDNPDEVNRYVTCVESIAGDNVDISITNNKDSKGEFTKLVQEWKRKGYDNIWFFDYGKNVGYLNAMLKPIKELKLTQYNYVALTNTDIEYADTMFFNRLLKNEYEETVGCIAPDVYEPNNDKHANPHYRDRISKQHYMFLNFIFSNTYIANMYLRLSILKNKRRNNERVDHGCYVYAPHGCYMIFLRQFILNILGNEYPVTLYSEEAYIAEMLNRMNMKCYYDPLLNVNHMESTVTGKIIPKERYGMWRESIQYILNEFY